MKEKLLQTIIQLAIALLNKLLEELIAKGNDPQVRVYNTKTTKENHDED